MPADIGHDFAVLDFWVGQPIFKLRRAYDASSTSWLAVGGRSLIFLIAILYSGRSHILPLEAELKEPQRVIVFQCCILNLKRRSHRAFRSAPQRRRWTVKSWMRSTFPERERETRCPVSYEFLIPFCARLDFMNSR